VFGNDDALLLVVRLRGDRRGGETGRESKNTGRKEDANTTSENGARREHPKQPILPTDRAVGMKAKPIMVAGLGLVDIQRSHPTPSVVVVIRA
jgi:hypothetical protein